MVFLLARELYHRSAKASHSNAFFDKISTYLTRESIQFNLYPQIISPHATQITSLDIDNTSEGRFLLCGSQDCTVSVYDLSLLGSDYHLNGSGDPDPDPDQWGGAIIDADDGTRTNINMVRRSRIVRGATTDEKKHSNEWRSKNRFRPIATSLKSFQTRMADRIRQEDPLFVPSGHSHTVTQVLWYPIDSGVFLSSDALGNILLWDTNAFTPVSCVRKTFVDLENTAPCCSIASMDLPTLTQSTHMLLAIGSCAPTGNVVRNNNPYSSYSSSSVMGRTARATALHMNDRVVYLCDLRSGSMTHQLAGHGVGGITCVKWSPVHDFLLASGSRDGTIKLWDIRKAGSTACIATLDRNNNVTTKTEVSAHVKRRRKSNIVGPSDYSQVECSSFVQSHAGPISNLQYTPDGNYIVSASCVDGLKLWNVQWQSESSVVGFGEIVPTKYTGENTGSTVQVQAQAHAQANPLNDYKVQNKVPMVITQPGSRASATVWVGGRNKKLLGYKIHGEGGGPDKVLSGHLDQVTALATQDNCARLFSGGKDGMILGYGNRNEFEPDYLCE